MKIIAYTQDGDERQLTADGTYQGVELHLGDGRSSFTMGPDDATRLANALHKAAFDAHVDANRMEREMEEMEGRPTGQLIDPNLPSQRRND